MEKDALSLISIRELSDFLCIHPKSAYKLVSNGDLPTVRLPGGGIRFRRETIELWLKERTKSAVPRLDSLKASRLPIGDFDKIPLKGGRTMSAGKRTRWNYGFGAIYERKTKRDGVRWYLDYRDAKGRRVQKVAPLAVSQEEAAVALQEAVRREFDAEYRAKREREKITFQRLADTYIDDYAKANKRSWKCDWYRIEANMKPFFGSLELQSITPLIIERYRSGRLEKGISRSSINREITIMKRMFNLAIDWGLADSNPFVKVKLFSEKDTQKERILELEEEARLFEVAPDYLKPILLMALHTGMRRGEILNLRWKQVDFEKRLVTVLLTKSGKNRLIPLNDVLMADLARLKASQCKGELVFANPRTGLPYTEVKKSFKGACKKVGITDLRFHDLRHTFATRLIQAGVDIITVKELLGHYSIRMTQRYTHSNQFQKKMAVDRLARMTATDKPERPDLLRICDTTKSEEAFVSPNHLGSTN